MEPIDVLVDKSECSTDELAVSLRKLLMAHDKSLKQISHLDEYISRLNKQSFTYRTKGKIDQELRTLNRISVALGVRHMYRQYRVRKWYNVQQHVKIIMDYLHDNRPSNQTPALLEVSGERESKAMEGIARSAMVAHSNFRRES